LTLTDFYQSKEWAALKKKVYARYGRSCMATGLTEKDGITLSVDHVKPRSKHPHLALKLSNMQVLELGLNKTKGARIVKDWRPLRWKAYYIVIRVIKLLCIPAIIYGYTILSPFLVDLSELLFSVLHIFDMFIEFVLSLDKHSLTGIFRHFTF
jgi:hypothetical protein